MKVNKGVSKGWLAGNPIQFHCICKLQFKVNVSHLQLFSSNQSKLSFIITSALSLGSLKIKKRLLIQSECKISPIRFLLCLYTLMPDKVPGPGMTIYYLICFTCLNLLPATNSKISESTRCCPV